MRRIWSRWSVFGQGVWEKTRDTAIWKRQPTLRHLLRSRVVTINALFRNESVLNEAAMNMDHREMTSHFEAFMGWIKGGFGGFYGAAWDDSAKPFEADEVARWSGFFRVLGGLSEKAEFDLSATFGFKANLHR